MVTEDKLLYQDGDKSWYQKILSNGRVSVYIIDKSRATELDFEQHKK